MQQAREYKLQLASDIAQWVSQVGLTALCAVACVLVAVFDAAPDSYLMLIPAGGCAAYALLVVRWHSPLNGSVQFSDIGIVGRAWLQAESFVPWSDITGVVWIGKRLWPWRPWVTWFHSLFVEVPELSYGRSRIKLGSSHWAGPIGEVRDKIVEHCGLQEVDELRLEPVFLWHSTKRQIWRWSSEEADR